MGGGRGSVTVHQCGDVVISLTYARNGGQQAMSFSSILTGAVLSAGLFAALVWHATTDGFLLRIDDGIATWISRNVGASAVHLADSLSYLGGPITLSVTVAVAVLALGLQRQWRGVVSFCLAIVGSGVTMAITKMLISRSRPAVSADVLTVGSSFPSASTALATVIFVGCATLVVPRLSTNMPLLPFRVVLVVLPMVVAFSRVLVSAHYVTDVVAGLCIGVFYVLLARLFLDRSWTVTPKN